MSVTGYSPYAYGHTNRAVTGSCYGGKVGRWKKGCATEALGASALMLLIFLLDIFVGIFGTGKDGNPFITMAMFGVLASGIVGYLAYNTFRELK